MAVYRKSNVVAGLVAVGAMCLLIAAPAAAQDEPNEALVQMVVELVSDADRDMRALGLQQIREEVPGEAATKTFAELLPKLSSEGQADLLGALGDRGDAAARDAVLDMLDSKEEPVRAAAILAVGSLGGSGDVALLAEKAAGGGEAEKAAARGALIRLRGDDVNTRLIGTMNDAEAGVQAVLLSVLARRNAKQAIPQVLESAAASDAEVRLAALSALRLLAETEHAAELAELVKQARNDAERGKAKLALLAVCTRGKEACAEAIIAAAEDAEPVGRIALLHALARAGGGDALKTLGDTATGKEVEASVRDEAVRLLSRWPSGEATAVLKQIAEESDVQRHQILAIRGLVRLAAAAKPPELGTLQKLFEAAPRREEKLLVLSGLSNVGTAEALEAVVPLFDGADFPEEAALAAVSIAEKMQGGPKDAVRAAMQKVLAKAKSQLTKDRAQKVIDAL